MKEKMYEEEAMYRLTLQADTDIYTAVLRAVYNAKSKKKLSVKYEEEYKRFSGLIKILRRGNIYIKPYTYEKKYFKRGRKV